MDNTTSQQEHERGKRRRRRQLLGFGLCLLILIGAFTVVRSAVGGVAILFDDTDEKLAYEKRLSALVMLDPLPFEGLENADQTQLREYGLWAAVFNAQSSAGSLDAYQRDPDTDSVILPAVEVDAALAALLGPDFKMEHANFESSDMMYNYLEEQKGYLVPVTSQMGQFTPKVQKLQKKSGKLRVTVGYVPLVGYNNDFSLSTPTEPVKYMDYVFEKTGKEYYLCALEASEMKASSSAVASQPEQDVDFDFDPASAIAGTAGLDSSSSSGAQSSPEDTSNSAPAE